MSDQSKTQTTEWPAAWAALADMDGYQWDAEDARLTTLWKAGYVGAFVAYAVSRKWTRENAETRAAEIADDALHYGFDADPADAACDDVIECEWDNANAE